jgi:hypothetical protein
MNEQNRGIGLILVFPDKPLQLTVIKAIEASSGIKPIGKGNTPLVDRAYYAEAPTRVIINFSRDAIYKELGLISAAVPIEVDNPREAAEKAKEIFKEAGYRATVHTNVEPNLPDGFMAFLVVPAMDRIALLYWPKNPDPVVVDAFRKSGDFGPWTATDYEH